MPRTDGLKMPQLFRLQRIQSNLLYHSYPKLQEDLGLCFLHSCPTKDWSKCSTNRTQIDTKGNGRKNHHLLNY